MSEINERLLNEIVDAVKEIVHKEESDRLRDVYLIGDIEKDTARGVDREAARARQQQQEADHRSTSTAPAATSPTASRSTTSIEHLVSTGIEVTIIVQGMAYSMGSVVLQAASPGRAAVAYPHSWIMIHEPAKWAGWQSTTAAAQHLDRLKQMQSQIYRIMADRSGKPLRQIIRDTKRVDFYLDAWKAKEYGLIDTVLGATTAPVRGTRSAAADGVRPDDAVDRRREMTIHGRSES